MEPGRLNASRYRMGMSASFPNRAIPRRALNSYIRTMAFYLVTAVPDRSRMKELSARLVGDEIVAMRPFGRSLAYSLRNARLRRDGVAVWEEEDYCRPPLAQEREEVLDTYFRDLKVEPVQEGDGWEKIEDLPRLFPEFSKV